MYLPLFLTSQWSQTGTSPANEVLLVYERYVIFNENHSFYLLGLLTPVLVVISFSSGKDLYLSWGDLEQHGKVKIDGWDTLLCTIFMNILECMLPFSQYRKLKGVISNIRKFPLKRSSILAIVSLQAFLISLLVLIILKSSVFWRLKTMSSLSPLHGSV